MNKEILILEDNDLDVEIYKRILEMDGANVTAVSRLSEALELISAKEFDVVIIDVKLPDGCGLELLFKLRELGAKSKIAIVTGSKLSELLCAGNIVANIENDENTNFFTKPIKKEQLLSL